MKKNKPEQYNQNIYWVGIDVGSTTVKIAVVDPQTKKLLHSKYMRHNAKQAEAVYEILTEAHEKYPDKEFKVAVCGSGGETVVGVINSFFIQEVVANSVAIKEFYKRTKVAIELGGQDAKVIFFHYDEKTKQIMASDMRMNGICAGGTGAFIDQVAELINVKIEDFGPLACKGENVYDISGRCGVFAKTDIQPLLNQGVSIEDIALSTFHAIAKQTIGGLAQGMEIHPPVIFEGGPLTFNPKLIEVFAERLELKDDEVIVPDSPETIVAYGTALSIGVMFYDKESKYDKVKSLDRLKNYEKYRKVSQNYESQLFFKNEKEKQDFLEKNKLPKFKPKQFKTGEEINVYLGIDAGSTTSKFVLMDEDEEIIDKFYANNDGAPLKVIQKALIKMRDKYKDAGVKLNIKAVGTTGYGENLFAKAFKADFHTVETVSHAEAALKYSSDVSFILDIGGQDMKAISIKSGIVTGIVLNEACSAGCGSFIETYAKSLQIPVNKISGLAFNSKNPSRLGSRCTVFMNSSIVTEQKNGKTTEDIMAGICKSIIENVFTKVVRVPNFDMLGDTVMVQGGTFKNDAVLRALEQYTNRKVIRASHPGEMGAIGIALLTKKYVKEQGKAFTESSFIGLDNLEEFGFKKTPGNICHFCSNNCNRTVIEFNDGSKYITGNRCERGEIIGNPKDDTIKAKLRATNKKMQSVPDMMKLRHELVFKDYEPKVVTHKKSMKIGIPRVLEFWNSMPFWKAFLTSLGFEVVLSKKSDYKLFEKGLNSIPSDTICFPAKIAHGHIQDLIEKKVDRIFMPMMTKIPSESTSANKGVHLCAVVQGYPVVIKESDEPQSRHGIPFDHPIFHWYNNSLRNKQLATFIQTTYGLPVDIIKQAIKEGDKAMNEFRSTLENEGEKVLKSLEGTDDFAVILAGRPYHSDELVNHSLSSHFTAMGIPVLTIDSLPGIHKVDLSRVRAETVNPFHVRMFGSAIYGARHPNLEVVQIVSFGCGHDAIITDEMIRLMNELSNKQLLVLKLDEGEAKGPLNIRIKSFIETIVAKRKKIDIHEEVKEYSKKELPEPFKQKFTKKDKKIRTLLAPNISPAFCKIISAVIRKLGYKVEPLPLASPRAIELGKKYVHNDICFPAQVNIGELLVELEKGRYTPDEVVAGFAKNCDDCRAGQYATLARKALDDAGYTQIPILTTGEDTKKMHPGFYGGIRFQVRMLWGLVIMDAMENMLRKTRPYELNKGESDKVFNHYLDRICEAIEKNVRSTVNVFKEAVKAFNDIETDRSIRKPRVFIIGEILLNYHPTSNNNMEKYLEENDMEVVLPTMVDFFRRDIVRVKDGLKRNQIEYPFLTSLITNVTDKLYDYALNKIEGIMKEFKYYEPVANIYDLSDNIKDLIDKTYVVGEGWSIPAEILQQIEEGVNSFVIIQPFGCLPNHITGRGLVKSIKKKYPHVQILSVDFDPDTSFANIENRLQMLIITAKENAKNKAKPERN